MAINRQELEQTEIHLTTQAVLAIRDRVLNLENKLPVRTGEILFASTMLILLLNEVSDEVLATEANTSAASLIDALQMSSLKSGVALRDIPVMALTLDGIDDLAKQPHVTTSEIPIHDINLRSGGLLGNLFSGRQLFWQKHLGGFVPSIRNRRDKVSNYIHVAGEDAYRQEKNKTEIQKLTQEPWRMYHIFSDNVAYLSDPRLREDEINWSTGTYTFTHGGPEITVTCFDGRVVRASYLVGLDEDQIAQLLPIVREQNSSRLTASK